MPVTAKTARLYNLLAVTSILITSGLVALALLECMVRLLFPIYDPSGQVDFVVGPNALTLGPTNQTMRQHKNTGDYDVAVHFNSRGFRDAKDVATARSGDIVAVGDSIAFGWGVEESQRFSNVLQTLLHRRVFNIAIPGSNFAGYDNLLKYAESLGAQIDDVVIAVSMETDLLPYSAPNQPAPPRRNEGRRFAPHGDATSWPGTRRHQTVALAQFGRLCNVYHRCSANSVAQEGCSSRQSFGPELGRNPKEYVFAGNH